jgi:hypothetical protein
MYHAHHLQHHLQLCGARAVGTGFKSTNIMALAKEPTPLSSQYPQLFDLQ